jgi:hypothetical protein
MGSRYQRPTDASLQLIPKRTSKWDMDENYLGEAYGLSSVKLPCFIGFMVYFFLSVAAPITFWVLWLSRWNHQADLQNAVIPIALVVSLWCMLFGCSGWSWNADREVE